jgi:hypothetical protein
MTVALLTSVDYADFLAVTLPAWRRLLPTATIRVVTSPADSETRMVAAWAGAEVHESTAWTTGRRARFNRARALDEALAEMRVGDICVSIDADCYPCGTWPEHFEPDVLYGCARYLCPTHADLLAHLQRRVPREGLSLMDVRLGAHGYGLAANTPADVARTAGECLGFCQAFRYAGQRFGSYPTAGGYDTDFRQQFARCEGLTDFYVLHLGPSAGRNWSGRVVPRWRVTA